MYGVDVSHHQRHGLVDWRHISQGSQFAICRATYGEAQDREVLNHYEDARSHGLITGLYHFFRPSQPVDKQIAAFDRVAQKVELGPGDIYPFLDIEMDPFPTKQHVEASWNDGCLQFVEAIEALYGGCGVYCNLADWVRLGSPQWVLERPIWAANWTREDEPLAPGGKWDIWQHRVGPYVANGVGGFYASGGLSIDQNVAKNLPLLAGARAK